MVDLAPCPEQLKRAEAVACNIAPRHTGSWDLAYKAALMAITWEAQATPDDKDAAVELAHALGISCEDFTSGKADILVQALARHRNTRSLPPSNEDWVEVVAKAIHGRSEYWPSGDDGENEMYREQAQRALTALTPLLDKVREDWVEEGLREKLADWQFNVMLECTRPPEEDLSIAIGGAVLDLRDLDRILRSLSKSPIEGEGG